MGTGAPTVIGLAVGRGTGTQVASVFGRVLQVLGQRYDAGFEVVRSPRIYHSYVSLKAEAGGLAQMRAHSKEDADHYEAFCRTVAARGVRAVFRTAINAQSLYLVRQRLHAAKVESLSADTARVLLVRDEAQGFYTGENQHQDGVVVRATRFSREVTVKLVEFAVARAWRLWPEKGPSSVVMAYKYHLLDGVFDGWAEEVSARLGVPIHVQQPDTVNRNLIARGLPDRTVIVAGNEWGDIMHVVLLDRFGSERQENRCTENVFLHPDVNGLVEYQTVHGSADDLQGTDTLNPLAAVRAAAHVAQAHGGCAGAVQVVESTIAAALDRGVRTPDLGGESSTTEMVDAVVEGLVAAQSARL